MQRFSFVVIDILPDVNMSPLLFCQFFFLAMKFFLCFHQKVEKEEQSKLEREEPAPTGGDWGGGDGDDWGGEVAGTTTLPPAGKSDPILFYLLKSKVIILLCYFTRYYY